MSSSPTKFVLATFCLLGAACTPRAAPPANASAALTEADSIRAVVLARVVAGGDVRGKPVVCVGVVDTGHARATSRPSPRLLAALGQQFPRIRFRPDSACRRQTEPLVFMNAVTETGTGAAAIDVWIGPIQRASASRAQAEVGSWCGALCAATYRCEVVRAEQGWTVTECTLLRVSVGPLPASDRARRAV